MLTVRWDLYESCPATGDPDGPAHTCPKVTYENFDGPCTHFACEGPQDDCGAIVAVEGDAGVEECDECRCHDGHDPKCSRAESECPGGNINVNALFEELEAIGRYLSELVTGGRWRVEIQETAPTVVVMLFDAREIGQERLYYRGDSLRGVLARAWAGEPPDEKR